MRAWRQRIPATRLKLGLARWLYRLARLFVGRRRTIRRRGITYEVDLAEGFDLSLFVFGVFQAHVTNRERFSLPGDATVFDVGANVGTAALPLAQALPSGTVYAFEPTDYAFGKLTRNLELNPELAPRVVPVQLFLSDRESEEPGIEAYASWRVDRRHQDAHRLHGGRRCPAAGVGATTLDAFCRRHGVERVDFIKIDTDGHEYRVLSGARRTVEACLPFILFEAGLYLLEENGVEFEAYDDYFSSLGYRLIHSQNGRPVNRETYRAEIPWKATADILAIPPQISR